jgi:hypothetical protein
VKQYVAIGMPSRVCQRLVGHAAAVDEPVLQVRLAAIERGQPDPAGERDALDDSFDVYALLGESIATELRDALPLGILVAGCRQLEDGPLIMGQREGDLGMRQRQAPHPFFDMAELSALGTQETPPRRRVVKQVVHFDRGTRRMRRWYRLTDLARIRFDLPRSVGFDTP